MRVLKPRYPSHAELDKKWSKLTRETKTRALEHVALLVDLLRRKKAYQVKKLKAEEGKLVGAECTCVPGIDRCNVDSLCEYCRQAHWDDYYNTPG